MGKKKTYHNSRRQTTVDLEQELTEKESQRTIANVSGVQGGLQGVQGRGLNEKLVKGRKIVYVHSQLESWIEIF